MFGMCHSIQKHKGIILKFERNYMVISILDSFSNTCILNERLFLTRQIKTVP